MKKLIFLPHCLTNLLSLILPSPLDPVQGRLNEVMSSSNGRILLHNKKYDSEQADKDPRRKCTEKILAHI